MLLRLYDVNTGAIQFHEKSLPAQRKSDKSFQTNKELGWFFFFSVVNCLTNLFLQKNAIELYTLVLTNVDRILQADPDLAMYNMQGTILTGS